MLRNPTDSHTVQHEFVHALGFWHEQQRADLDKHIDVNADRWTCEDISFGDDLNFKCLQCDMPEIFPDWRAWEDQWSPYDYNSIMHYQGSVGCGNKLLVYEGTNNAVNPIG